ncbi:MAG: phosphoribosylamine--glycine ligase [Clostridia bacterium]
MKVLVVGSGGREHTIIWKLSQSKKVTEIIAAPGNAGIMSLAKCFNVKATDLEGMLNLAKAEKPDMIVVAPDDPLSMGMVDLLTENGFSTFGPTKMAARIESSKSFSKDLMKKYDIPTADYQVFTDSEKAISYIKEKGAPIVVKASGLALGKGVVVATTEEMAIDAVNSIMGDKIFGNAGNEVVIEECLSGPEISVLAFTDGKVIVPMVSAQDHKRAFDNDEGPNTGGMGAFSPSKYYTSELAKECMDTIYLKTLNALNSENCKFKGVIYFGLMLTAKGPYVIEYNARFGDPETQVVLTRLKSDLFDIFMSVIDETLSEQKIEWLEDAAVCVMMASGGYPLKYKTGLDITGLENVKDAIVFHSGTKIGENGKLQTAGGRVLGITTLSDTVLNAAQKAYENVAKIHFDNAHFRHDIGNK